MDASAIEPTPAELRLIESAARGEVAGFVPPEPGRVRAEVVVALAAGLRPDWQTHPFGVRLHGAEIDGSLNFSSMKIEVPLELIECRVVEPIVLVDAQTRTIRLSGSRIVGIDGCRLRMKGGLYLGGGFHSRGEILLRDASIDGSLEAEGGATFDTPGETALNGARMSVTGSVVFQSEGSWRFRANGRVYLPAVRIGGSLECDGAHFDHPEGTALAADGADIGGVVVLRGARANGRVRFLYAKIGRTFECDGAFFSSDLDPCLWLDGANIGGSLFLRNGFLVDGEVRMLGIDIQGELDASHGKFNNARGCSLRADRARIRAAVLMHGSFFARGTLRLSDVEIGGNLECLGGFLDTPQGDALFADGMSTNGAVLLRDGFGARGTIRLVYADIGDSLECDGSYLEGTGASEDEPRVALVAEGMKTRGSVLLREGFRAKGDINLRGAVIGGGLELTRARIDGRVSVAGAEVGRDLLCSETVLERSDAEDARPSFEGDELRVVGAFQWTDMEHQPADRLVTLSGAKVGRLEDDDHSWPAKVQIDNFCYDSLAHRACIISARLRWLRSQDNFSPEPFEQAVQVLRRMGYEKGARQIAMAKSQELRRHGGLGRPAILWNHFLGLTMGHGYQVWRAPLFLLALVVLGAFIFQSAYNQGGMVETKPLAEVPRFDPLVYSLDAGLPVVNLHQEDFWLPKGESAGRNVQIYLWVHILMGWMLTTLTVVGISGLVKRE